MIKRLDIPGTKQARLLTLLYIVVFIGWFGLAFIAGLYHEPWADEAQSWLIARDVPIGQLFTHTLHYEGSPALFFLLLKFLQCFHFPYQALFLVPLVFTGVGVYLLLFKSKLSPVIKILFPFTYYIAYQYAVVGRNYCLIFPLLAFIAIFYTRRLQKPFLYAFLLILLLSVSAYGFLLAGILCLYFMEDVYQKQRHKLSSWVAIGIVCVGMLLTASYVSKSVDCSYVAKISLQDLDTFYPILTNGFFDVSRYIIQWFYLFFVLLLYMLAFLLFCKTKRQRVFFLFINWALIFALSVLHCVFWHSGYIIIVLIFCIWVLQEENQNKEYPLPNKWIKWGFYAVFIIIVNTQICWSWAALRYDIKHEYSASLQASKFLKEKGLEKYSIYALGYRTVSMQPYFSQNIYKNFDVSYWPWQIQAEFDIHYNALQKPSVIVWDVVCYSKYRGLLKYLSAQYDSYMFKGKMFGKSGIKERTDLVIFVRKGLL